MFLFKEKAIWSLQPDSFLSSLQTPESGSFSSHLFLCHECWLHHPDLLPRISNYKRVFPKKEEELGCKKEDENSSHFSAFPPFWYQLFFFSFLFYSSLLLSSTSLFFYFLFSFFFFLRPRLLYWTWIPHTTKTTSSSWSPTLFSACLDYWSPPLHLVLCYARILFLLDKHSVNWAPSLVP